MSFSCGLIIDGALPVLQLITRFLGAGSLLCPSDSRKFTEKYHAERHKVEHYCDNQFPNLL